MITSLYNYKHSLGIPLLIVLISTLQDACVAQNSPQDYLDAHNAARAQVGVRNMVWDDKVAAFAQSYINSRLGDCKLMHSGTHGENIAKGPDGFTGRGAVDLWVGERPNYDHDSNTCVGGLCRHYTQVVWRKSVRLGCARARCINEASWFVACYYDPPGNFIGETPY